jgi:hypothetical protein
MKNRAIRDGPGLSLRAVIEQALQIKGIDLHLQTPDCRTAESIPHILHNCDSALFIGKLCLELPAQPLLFVTADMTVELHWGLAQFAPDNAGFAGGESREGGVMD